MADLARRQFLGASLSAAAYGWLGFPRVGLGAASDLLGVVPFVDEGGSPIGTLIEGSHQGRLVVDLKALSRDKLTTPNDEFFIRTRYPDGLHHEGPWELAVRGLVHEETSLPLANLMDLVEDQGVQLLECSGNSKRREFGLLSSTEWSGVPIQRVIERARPVAGATRLLVSGHDEHSDFQSPRSRGASWVYSFDQLAESGAYLATHMNGALLPRDHGQPVRIIMPNWYGCTCIKWVNELRFVDDEEPSTMQMREFAARTHQDGVPMLAREYIPATMDQTGMPIRVEKWKVGSGLSYRVWGLLWGGNRPTDRVRIRFRDDLPDEPLVYEQASNHTWTLWSHEFRPKALGRYTVTLSVDDPAIRTRRLDRGYYARSFDIDEI